MELRARTRPTLRRACLMAALPALLVPAVAGTTDAHAAKDPSPVVKRITPKHVFVGQTLTIRGRNFRRGLNKNTVAFKRKGAKAVFVKAEKGTAKLLKVTLPKRLESVLIVRNGTPVPTRLKVRVLARKFGKRYTSKRLSPIVGAEKPPAPPKPPAVDPNADCDGDRIKNSLDADDDNDLLADTLEKSLKLDPCHVDSDRDDVEDGYEYRSALNLNDDEHQSPNLSTPYPAKKPYPNPLDGTDQNTDHDGDTLTLKDEYDLWKYTIRKGAPRTLVPLTYSAGEQFSRRTSNGAPNLPAANYDRQNQFRQWAAGAGYLNVKLVHPGDNLEDAYNGDVWWAAGTLYDIRDFDRDGNNLETATYYDRDGNARLDDAERDEDADGLPNQWESTGCLTQDYWNGLYDKETKYYLRYAGVRLDDEDTDGDGVRDGADDQDHDDVPNVMECSRVLAHGAIGGYDDEDLADPTTFGSRPWKAFVNPFNPCLPHVRSRTCKQYVAVGGGAAQWAPFNPDDEYYWIKN
jgi:hypothetical protein